MRISMATVKQAAGAAQPGVAAPPAAAPAAPGGGAPGAHAVLVTISFKATTHSRQDTRQLTVPAAAAAAPTAPAAAAAPAAAGKPALASRASAVQQDATALPANTLTLTLSGLDGAEQASGPIAGSVVLEEGG